jgi:hypothetical protein
MPAGFAELNAIITTFINIATGLALGLASFFFIVSAIQYAMSGGDMQSKMKGVDGMMSAGKGLGFVLAARVILGMIQGAIPH